MGQISEEWWSNDTDSVDAFRFFIATAIRIHIINVLKCNVCPCDPIQVIASGYGKNHMISLML
jgi:hypothetical protein